MNKLEQIRALINRLARLDAAETWMGDLNPAQIAALDYLARANRFSRAPSHVAEYLGTTRGTMSQTLKTLARKGFVDERRSEADKRSIVYDLTPSGRAVSERENLMAHSLGTLPPGQRDKLHEILSTALAARLAANGGRAFGVCKFCEHHRDADGGAYCALLSVTLAPEETEQICHEQVPA